MSTLTHAQRLAWKNKVLRGDSARDLSWLIRKTGMADEDYPVNYPNGKREAVELRIHETLDSVMKQLKADEKTELKRGHDYILDKMKNEKKKYFIGKHLWTPVKHLPVDGGVTKKNVEVEQDHV